jgi:hypothetical protein
MESSFRFVLPSANRRDRSARIYVDLVGLSEEDSLRTKLLEGVKQGRATSDPSSDSYVGQTKPALPVAIHRTIHTTCLSYRIPYLRDMRQIRKD